MPLPNKNTNSINRPKPSTRETSVPATMIALAEINREVRLVVVGAETSVSDIKQLAAGAGARFARALVKHRLVRRSGSPAVPASWICGT